MNGIGASGMCGIVGIVGSAPVAPLIVDALKRLEYRGYDSAGVATVENGALARPRQRILARCRSDDLADRSQAFFLISRIS